MGGYSDATGKRRYLSGKVQNELALKRRQGAAKRQLPKYSQDVYREVRAELDEEYAAKQEHGGMSKVEQERKNEAANKVYAGVGAFGGKRRNEPDAGYFSN